MPTRRTFLSTIAAAFAVPFVPKAAEANPAQIVSGTGTFCGETAADISWTVTASEVARSYHVPPTGVLTMSVEEVRRLFDQIGPHYR